MVDCGNCLIDPCHLKGKECEAFLNIVEVFKTLSLERESCDYLHG